MFSFYNKMLRPTQNRVTFMKKSTLLLCLACLFLASCNFFGKKSEASHFAFKENEKDNWGVMDLKGKVICEDMFEKRPSIVVNGIFFVPNDDYEYEMYSIKNVNNPIGDTYKDILPFHEKVTPSVKKGEGIKYIDKEGNVKFKLPNKYVEAYAFQNGYSIIAEKDEDSDYDYDYVYDAISTKGDIVSFSKYSIMAALGKDKFLVIEKNKDKAHIVNKKGEIKNTLKDFPTKYLEPDPELIERLFSPDKKLYLYLEDQKEDYVGIRSIDGDVVIKAKRNRPCVFDKNGNVMFAEDNGKEELIGVMDLKGNVIIKPKYADMAAVGDGMYLAMNAKNEKYGMIDEKGNELIPFDYYSIRAISPKAFIARENDWDDYENNDYVLMDKKGNVLAEFCDYSVGEDYVVRSDRR